MSYGYGDNMGMMHGGFGGGYSYSTLTASMDIPSSDSYETRFGRSRVFPRHQSFSAGRPYVDRKYSPPVARHRCDLGPSPSTYTSLHSGLTLPRSAVGKSGHTHHRDKYKEKDHHHRAPESSRRKSHGDHGHRPAAPARPSAKHSDSHHTSKSRRDSKVAGDGKRHSTQLLQPPRPSSPRRKSTSSVKKHSHDDNKASCSGRHSTTSNRTKSTSCSRPRSISSKKSASRKSRKPKSKGMFGWGCFGS